MSLTITSSIISIGKFWGCFCVLCISPTTGYNNPCRVSAGNKQYLIDLNGFIIYSSSAKKACSEEHSLPT